MSQFDISIRNSEIRFFSQTLWFKYTILWPSRVSVLWSYFSKVGQVASHSDIIVNLRLLWKSCTITSKYCNKRPNGNKFKRHYTLWRGKGLFSTVQMADCDWVDVNRRQSHMSWFRSNGCMNSVHMFVDTQQLIGEWIDQVMYHNGTYWYIFVIGKILYCVGMKKTRKSPAWVFASSIKTEKKIYQINTRIDGERWAQNTTLRRCL